MTYRGKRVSGESVPLEALNTVVATFSSMTRGDP